MDFVLEDDTPVVENKPFARGEEQDGLQGRKEAASHTSSSSSPGSSSSASSSSSSSSPSSCASSPDSHALRREHKRGAKAKKDRQKREKASSSSAAAPPAPPSTSDMSNSYHEIFDAQMPPEKAASLLEREIAGEDEDGVDGVTSAAASLMLLPSEDTARDTTDYLTSKLVQDSLRWQQENSSSRATPPLPTSPLRSPRRRQHHPALHAPAPSGQQPASLSPPLDPTALLDMENDARHLATAVDSLVESLSGVLHSASALTVDAVETYRDGVCKTCDEVDGNIKSMYQLMAKVEELNKSMAPAYKLAEQVKDIKRLLEVFEAAAGSSRFKTH